MLGQIGLFTLVLSLSIAFLLLLDRKVWAAVMMRKGPNVVGPFGLMQSFADFGKFLLKEIIIPAGANKTVFLIAPDPDADSGLRGLGGHSRGAGLGDFRHQCRHLVPVRDLIAGRLWHHHGRLGVKLEIPVPGLASQRCANGVL